MNACPVYEICAFGLAIPDRNKKKWELGEEFAALKWVVQAVCFLKINNCILLLGVLISSMSNEKKRLIHLYILF